MRVTLNVHHQSADIDRPN